MALNFLVTGVKMLSKAMDKKKMKDKAKKFVSGGKEEKRKKVRNIMESEGTYGDESKKKISPTKLLEIPEIPDVKPAVSGRIDFNLLSDRLDNIVGMTDALGFLTDTQAKQKKDELKLLEIQNKKSKSKKREKKLEKKDGLLGKASKGVKKAAQGPLDALTKFLTNIALGALTLFLIKNAKKIKEMFKNIGENIEKYGKILRVSIFAFGEGMKLAKASFNLMGKGVNKLLSPVGKAFKFIGSKFTKTLQLLGKSLKAAFMAIPGMTRLTKLTSDAVRGVTTGVDAATTAIRGVGSGATQILNKATGNVFSRGGARAPGRLLIKIFGSSKAKSIMKIGKGLKAATSGLTIPILGPIIVAVTSVLAGDPVKQTLAKSLSAGLGGAIGAALPLPVPGNPLAMLVGEMIGEFIGNFVYEIFNGDDQNVKGKALIKKKFDQLINGIGKGGKMFFNFMVSMVGKAGNFIKDGVDRFIKNFPIIKVPTFGGLQSTLGLSASALGLDEKSKFIEKGEGLFGTSINLVTSLPDLSLLTVFGMHKLIPHFKNSFFPSGEEEQVTVSTGSGDKPEDYVSFEDSLDTYTMTEEDLKNAKEREERNKKRSQLMQDLADGKITQKEFDKKIEELGGMANLVKSDNEIIPTSDNSKGNVLSSNAEIASNSSSIASTTSAISSQASYEQSSAGTVILGEPSRSDFPSGAGGDAQFQRAIILAANQKTMLNSYYKTQVKASLYKV